MKVLAGPRVDLDPAGAAVEVCDRLAGEHGTVVSLSALGIRNPYRRMSAAEVEALRAVLRGETGVVGFVCRGVALGAAAAGAGPAELVSPGTVAGALVAVTDHVNLTWRSPLIGPKEQRPASGRC